MEKGKKIKNYLKMDSLKMDSKLGIHSLHDGFSVNLDVQIKGYDAFSKHFRSDFFQLILFKAGQANLSLNLIDYQVEKNSFILCTPFDIKRVNSFNISEHSVIVFTSDFLEKSGLLKNSSEVLQYFTSQYSPQWKLDDADSHLLDNLMKDVAYRHDNVPNHRYGKELLYLSFSTFLYELAAIGDKYSQSITKQTSRKENTVLQFTSLVKIRFKSQRGLDFYASLLHITPKYLTTTVKEVTGKSASKIIESFVVQEAQMLLENQMLSVAQIADELNFSNQSFFGKFFKRLTGSSPSDYRKI